MVVTSDGNGIGECALKLFTSDVVKGHYAYMVDDMKSCPCLPCHQVWFHSGQRIEVASKDNSLIISKCPAGGQSLSVPSLKTFSMPSNSSIKAWARMKRLELIQILQNCVPCV